MRAARDPLCRLWGRPLPETASRPASPRNSLANTKRIQADFFFALRATPYDSGGGLSPKQPHGRPLPETASRTPSEFKLNFFSRCARPPKSTLRPASSRNSLAKALSLLLGRPLPETASRRPFDYKGRLVTRSCLCGICRSGLCLPE